MGNTDKQHTVGLVVVAVVHLVTRHYRNRVKVLLNLHMILAQLMTVSHFVVMPFHRRKSNHLLLNIVAEKIFTKYRFLYYIFFSINFKLIILANYRWNTALNLSDISIIIIQFVQNIIVCIFFNDSSTRAYNWNATSMLNIFTLKFFKVHVKLSFTMFFSCFFFVCKKKLIM